MTLIGAHIRVENKLDIEAGSILVNRDRTEFTAYKTKSFSFTGRVVVGKENNGICKFRLGEDTLVIE